MCYYSFFAYFVYAFFPNQARNGVEGAADFECADALEVFAFEEQTDFWMGGFLTFPLCSFQCFGCLGCRGKIAQRGVGEHGGIMDVGFDKSMSGFDV